MRNGRDSQASAFNPSHYSPIPKVGKLYFYLTSLCFKMNHYCLSYLPTLSPPPPFITILSVTMLSLSLFFCLANISNSLFFTYAHVFCLSAYPSSLNSGRFPIEPHFSWLLANTPWLGAETKGGNGNPVLEKSLVSSFAKQRWEEKRRKAEVGECDQRPHVSFRVIC